MSDGAPRPTVFVDADACPVKDEVRAVAMACGARVVQVSSVAHVMADPGEGVEVVTVDNEPEAADLAIANRVGAGDVVVTQDYGLASMCLGKRARVLSPRGIEYTEHNIDRLLAQRHDFNKMRRSRRMRTQYSGPAVFQAADRTRFREALARILEESG